MPKWDIIIPLRGGGNGSKSRLVGKEASRGLGSAIAFAFANDVVDIVKKHPSVANAIILTGHKATANVFRERDINTVLDSEHENLNASIIALSKKLRVNNPEHFQGVLVADLPSLSSEDFSTLLNLAASNPRSVLSDQDQKGTCFISCNSSSTLEACFGVNSFKRHVETGCIPLKPVFTKGLWADVDTASDLQNALRLGVGVHTAQLLAHLKMLEVNEISQ